ncbi:unnamed protein product [Discula destructiva]
MNSRAFSIATRSIRPAPRSLSLRTPIQRRFASSDPERFNIAQFYKTFTRPVTKVLLMAFFTYQLAYWSWTKLEQDEIMQEREAYIAELEDEIYWLTGTLVGPAATKAKEAEATTSGMDDQDRLQYYQRQLMELEERNKHLLKAIAQAGPASGVANGEQPVGEEKKTSPWWKLW